MKILFVIIALFFGHSAQALSPSEIRDQIESQMRERHPHPPVDFWEKLGPEALPVLKAMVAEESAPVRRSWLIEGLAHFSDPSVAGILEKEVQGTENVVFKKKLLSALIQSQGDAAFEFVEPYLKDADPHIRLAVARGIKERMSESKAVARLSQYQSEEKEIWVKADLSKTPVALTASAGGGRTIRSLPTDQKVESEKKRKPDLSGEWSGVFVRSSKVSPARVFLSQKGETLKVDLRLSKQPKVELKTGDPEVVSFESDHLLWIEVRMKKDDSVFLGSRKVK